MSDVFLINERELLALGISRSTVAALRNIQRVSGVSADANSLEEAQVVFLSAIADFHRALAAQRQENYLLREELATRRQPVQNNEELLFLIGKRSPIAVQYDEPQNRAPNLQTILRRLDAVETFLGI